MMKLTGQAINEIKAVITRPLECGELRQIVSMGNLFVSMQRLPEDDDGIALTNVSAMEYWFQYSLKIEGVMYYFYGGASNT